MVLAVPQVLRTSTIFARVEGIFYRAIDPRYSEDAIVPVGLSRTRGERIEGFKAQAMIDA
ncbi:hypothetical protein [Sphingobium chlorophenolicum]|uniref:Uncharacterized protein n=1 Tax=Sphingobium chlorophenolicum TaxID=46429 RepID=A0A081R932_SPHCR|nr:hypothetical protein [Sphingobium chlorophenolicum]KEQ51705.1 hypothetical protein BV95_04039 [Sphingobium chlorophenolicum]